LLRRTYGGLIENMQRFCKIGLTSLMAVDVKNLIRIESDSKMMEFLRKILSIVGRLENVCAISMLNNKLEMQIFMLPKNTKNDVTENFRG